MKDMFEGKNLITTQDVADAQIMSLSKQHEERQAGRLKHIRIGRKVMYLSHHITEYLALCEHGGQSQLNADE